MSNAPPNIAILQNHSLTMLVQRELERMVLAGELAAGEKLNELALAERLGVSRGPVREALRALAETGLVRIEKNRGVFVREISVAEADEIYELRATLDQMAGRKLAPGDPPGAARRAARGGQAHAGRGDRATTARATTSPTCASTTRSSSSRATPSCCRCTAGSSTS